jgi:hypothetical protein
MATLTPVDHDPFSEAAPSDGPLRLTVHPLPKERKLTPVDHDPFAPMGAGEDVARSAGSGVVRGAAGIVGIGGDITKGIAAAEKVHDPAEVKASKDKALAWMPGWLSRFYEAPTKDLGSKEVMAGIDQATGRGVTSYEPKTTLGKYARTGGEFVAGAVLSPGGVVGNAIRYGVIPGLASEGAGQAAQAVAPQYEGAARLVGALGGAGIGAMTARPGTAAQAIRQQLPPGVTPQMVDDAARLMDDAAQQGIQLSWPEALSQVAGRPVMTNTLRHLEAAPQTEARMGEFFGGRPQAVEASARQQFDTIAPPNNAPSTIGPAVGQAADDAVGHQRGLINQYTEADYRAASTVQLSPQEMAQVRAVPGFDRAAREVRADEQLNRHVANLPDNSVGFLNEVKKVLDQQARNATAPAAQNPSVQRAAGLGMDADAVRDAGTRASADYAIALETQARLRQQYLEPLLQGPLGKLAERDKTTRDAINALFPPNPLPNSSNEVGTAVRAVAQRNPTAARDLVRAHVEGTFNEAAQALQSGANQAGGAKFRATLVGNAQQAANLEAAVRALPNGDQVWTGFNRYLEILEATGTRQNPGSRTAYNEAFLKETAASGVVGEAVKGAANPISRFTQGLVDRYERYRLGRNLNELADLLTNPASANQLRAIARMPVHSAQGAALALRIGQASHSSSLKERSK